LAVVALPNDFAVHDLEKMLANRRRQRATVNTTSLAGFQSYVEAQHEEGAMVFVDPIKMQATAVLNAGTPEAPGHADHVCVFSPPKTAAWAALSGILGQRLNQRTLAEFFEDWAPHISAWSQPGGLQLDLPKAIAAIRKVTIESVRKAETEQSQLSQSASTFESVSAQSSLPLPRWTVFTCTPYADTTAARRFELRLSIITSEKEPMLTLRLAKAEQHAEEMGRDLLSLCHEVTQGHSLLCVLGTYTKAA
jgi:uncharacterized protein YfdQ (DUF2303 family)